MNEYIYIYTPCKQNAEFFSSVLVLNMASTKAEDVNSFLGNAIYINQALISVTGDWINTPFWLI